MCFPLVLARAVCILREGWKGEGGGGRLVIRLCSEYIFLTTLGMLLLEMVVVLAGELSLAMASSLVWGFAEARFDLL